MLSNGMGCDCSGCCLASLSPLAPPATPPPLPPAPTPPIPLLPPVAPGVLAVGSTAELRAALATAGSRPVYLLPIVYPLGGVPLNVSGFNVTLEGMGFGATIDAETMSRAIDVGDGGRLVLRRIEVINGAASVDGGGLRIDGADSSLLMEQVTVRDCVAGLYGGRLACSFVSSSQRAHSAHSASPHAVHQPYLRTLSPIHSLASFSQVGWPFGVRVLCYWTAQLRAATRQGGGDRLVAALRPTEPT